MIEKTGRGRPVFTSFGKICGRSGLDKAVPLWYIIIPDNAG